mmetsp:Transcript_24801/g.37695  ORF Transcript_24801/g.37695 Transcript_24801/m.37695 type:complete len:203 (-) Transcript_24801:231-839(-)|eukprot:CAMPEP_0178938460 /NCGR_PEP_ID=MMETSP0786-20121207/26343_1 /TAXON_ID=186022 /ORGANISM="Thalassionema frauenfeldii, Strain CCMP 1798" /LENGTH=202 /DNA_ID=CAMNT_0020617181 /DNA_START=8 /DNA_END=616 /DNA_ORIENTATION=+
MKITLLSLLLSYVTSFQIAPGTSRISNTALQATTDRRQFATQSLLTLTTGLAAPQVSSAFARGENYVPKFDDLKLIYGLGTSLDNLVKKLSDESTVESGLDGVRMFNRDPNFYTGYAKNYISKSILRRADEDPRVGYIRSASTLIGSIESLLQGGAGLVEKDASKEAVKRVEKAQGYIAKFLAESGVEGNADVDAYVKKHPL